MLPRATIVEAVRFEKNAKTNHFICNFVVVMFYMHLHVCARTVLVYGQAPSKHCQTNHHSDQQRNVSTYLDFILQPKTQLNCVKNFILNVDDDSSDSCFSQVCENHAKSLWFIDSEKYEFMIHWFPPKAELALERVRKQRKKK